MTLPISQVPYAARFSNRGESRGGASNGAVPSHRVPNNEPVCLLGPGSHVRDSRDAV